MKTFVMGALLTSILALSLGCASGPKRYSRGWDDYVNQRYTEDSIVHGLVLQDLLPVYGFVGFGAAIVDAFANMYYFWGEDVWDGRGTGFVHDNPTGAARTVSSP